ncbi:MAG: hypothetical protein K0S70_191 [Microbacterium sp.]|jgi:hypothetical protein|nr:hypothetical protein [Microbacterium sp.]
MPHPYLGIAVVAVVILLAIVGLATTLGKKAYTWVAIRTGRAHVEYRDGHRVIVWGKAT